MQKHIVVLPTIYTENMYIWQLLMLLRVLWLPNAIIACGISQHGVKYVEMFLLGSQPCFLLFLLHFVKTITDDKAKPLQ